MTPSAAVNSLQHIPVLHVISSLNPASGGPAQALVGLALAQRNAGLDVRVLATSRQTSDESLTRQLTDGDVEVDVIGPCSGLLRSHPSLQSASVRAVSESAIVHIHGLWEQVQHEAAVACRQLNKPYIFRPCGMLDPWCLAQNRFKKRLYLLWRLRKDLNGASLLHFTSEQEQALAQPLNLKPSGIVEPNGVILEEFDQLPPSGAFRQQLGLSPDQPLLLFLSRLHKKKGLDLLLPAFSQVEDPDAVLVLAGPDDRGYRSEVEAMVRRLQLDQRVILTGMLKGQQKLSALVDADLFVLPSYQENFGISVVEALAAGTPVIISDQVNIHDRIAQAKVGKVVPTQVEPLANAMKGWLRDCESRSSAAAGARGFVRSNFDWRVIAARWHQRYADVLASD